MHYDGGVEGEQRVNSIRADLKYLSLKRQDVFPFEKYVNPLKEYYNTLKELGHPEF